MNFKDQWATDENDNKFVFTVEMQRKLADAGEAVSAEAWLTFKATHAPPPPPPRKRDREPAPQRERVQIGAMEQDEATGKYIGILKSFNSRKGFGFIGRGDGNDIYFHERNTLDNPSHISSGSKVLYEVKSFRGKDEATEVEEFLE